MEEIRVSDIERMRVMAVDDDRPTRLLIRTFLEHLGFRDVVERETAEEALRDLRRKHFDLLISDLEMQPMDGWQLLQQLRRDENVMNPHIPVILATQHGDRASVLKARDSGASAFIVKPIDFQKLNRTVAAVLGDSRPFVKTDGYAGPDRRRQDKLPKDGKYRREDDYTW